MRALLAMAVAVALVALFSGCGGSSGEVVAPSASSTTAGPTTTAAAPGSPGATDAAAKAYLAIVTPANTQIARINHDLDAARAANDWAGAARALRALERLTRSVQGKLVRISVPADSQSALDGLVQATGRVAIAGGAMAADFDARRSPSEELVSEFRQALADSSSWSQTLRARLGLPAL